MAPRRSTPLVLLFAIAAVACTDPSSPGMRRSSVADVDADLRILFVGNSLTATNDLPGTLARIAAIDAGRRVATKDLSRPNHALMDHWALGADAELDRADYDVVVLQQGPSSLPDSRENLIEWSVRWADAIRTHGARPALMTVWPSLARRDVFDDVVLSYRLAAENSDAALFAAGEAWRHAWESDPSMPLYGPDGFHPSPTGTLLAALVVHAALFGDVPAVEDLRASNVDAARALDPRRLGILRQAALRATGG